MQKRYKHIPFSKKLLRLALLTGMSALLLAISSGCAQHSHAHADSQHMNVGEENMSLINFHDEPENADTTYIKKLLIIGDSMTGWMAERFNEYGKINDFEVSTVIWDGSTVSKWANSDNLEKIIERHNPDAVIVSLGMNELFIPNPATKLNEPVDKILHAIGDRPYLWIGPPLWKSIEKGENFNSWMLEKLGSDKYFRSDSLSIARQSKANPHPSRSGMETWVDTIASWIPEHSGLRFKSLERPESGKISRPADYTYKKMKEKL